MEKIFSKVNPETILHVVHRKDHFDQPIKELSTNEQYLQVLSMVFPKDRLVPPHKHIETSKETKITQEALIVIEGEIEATFYDLDHSVLDVKKLKDGDCSITFGGGHKFIALSPTKLYEVKNGPYYGKDKDKEMI